MMRLPPVDPQAAARAAQAETASPSAAPADNLVPTGRRHDALTSLRVGANPTAKESPAQARPRVAASSLRLPRARTPARPVPSTAPALAAHLQTGVMAATAAITALGPELGGAVWSVPSGRRLATAERAIKSLMQRIDGV